MKKVETDAIFMNWRTKGWNLALAEAEQRLNKYFEKHGSWEIAQDIRKVIRGCRDKSGKARYK